MSEKNEIHLFIIWSKARYLEKEIVDDINKNFDIKGKYRISWSKEKFSNNLSRFYGKNLPPNSHKEKHCGDEEFLALIVEDIKPKYVEKEIGNNRGKVLVNDNTYRAKIKYRSWTGGGHKIHATNDTMESEKDIFFLLGEKFESFLSVEGIIEEDLTQDLVGTNGWNNLEEFFYAANQFSQYALLNLSNTTISESSLSEKNDIDFITNDSKEFAFLVNARQGGKKHSCARYIVKISDKNIPIDIYDYDSNYFDFKWLQKMIDERCLVTSLDTNVPTYYGLNDIDRKYGLIYHAIFHKEFNGKYHDALLKDFQSIDIKFLKSRLDNFMNEKSFSYFEPKDITVNFDNFSLLHIPISFKRRIYKIYKKLKSYVRNSKVVS